MKGRFMQYLLLFLVLIIWGIVIFKILKQNKKEEFVNPGNKNTSIDSNQSLIDSFSISILKTDAFVEVIGDELENNLEESSSDYLSNAPILPLPVIWPSAHYFGIISSSKNKEQKIALLRLENSDVFLKKGDEIKGLKVINVYQDSIVLQFKTSYKTLKKYE